MNNYIRCWAMIALVSFAVVIGYPLGAVGQEMEAPINAAPAETPIPLGVPPYISLQPVPGYGVAPLTVAFYVNGDDPEGAGFVSYHWDFGDGRVSTLPPLLIYENYTRPGSYIVTLTAVTADGRSATAVASVVVRAAASR